MSTKNYNTLEEQIKGETSAEISYRNLFSRLEIKDIDSKLKVILPYISATNKYRYFLQDCVLECDLDEDRYNLFRHNPQAMSEAIYGTTLLWHVILELNNCVSRTDFDTSHVKYYDFQKLYEMINEIMIKEEELKYPIIY